MFRLPAPCPLSMAFAALAAVPPQQMRRTRSCISDKTSDLWTPVGGDCCGHALQVLLRSSTLRIGGGMLLHN